jgi:hypothetical protein
VVGEAKRSADFSQAPAAFCVCGSFFISITV